jgi:hypothetical protein
VLNDKDWETKLTTGSQAHVDVYLKFLENEGDEAAQKVIDAFGSTIADVNAHVLQLLMIIPRSDCIFHSKRILLRTK